MKKSIYSLILILLFMSCANKEKDPTDWCSQELNPKLKELKEVKTSHEWFKVYTVGDNVLAIAEPFNYQEVISFLILGNEKALLFDTGMGLDSMSAVVKELTNLPVTVINSHTHYDHIGSNHEFENILAMNTEYTLKWAKNGWKHDLVKHEVAKDAFCLDKLPKTDTTNYHIKPYKISKFIEDGYVIDLGNREIEVISVPGHTPDCIALLDKKSGYLWVGDTYYESTIWLFFEGTDLNAYEKSTAKLAALAPDLKKVYTAHNQPMVDPVRLTELHKAFTEVISGKKKAEELAYSGHPDANRGEIFKFENFSFLIRKDHLSLLLDEN